MALPEFEISGQVALVTGAGRGIAAGVARVLAEAGVDLAVNALTLRYLEGLTEEITETTGRRVLALPADMTSSEEVDRVVDEVIREFGRIDILVNGVGDAIRKPLVPPPSDDQAERVTDDELDLTLGLNLTAAILCCRAVGSHMVERGSGAVISIGSFAGLRGGANVSLYAAGKAGLSGFTRALALEWAPYGVRVNVIAPGTFPDPVTAGEEGYQRAAERARNAVPLGRAGDPREVGLLAAHLASPAASYMTGQTLYLDGGTTL